MINSLKSFLKYNGLLYQLMGWIYFYLQYFYITFFQIVFSCIPIKKNKIIFISYYGKGYGDSGKYICQKLSNNQYDIYWAYNSKKAKETIPKNIIPIKFNSIIYLYHLSTARIWVNNTRFLYGTRKRKNQIYIQLWHGGIALKKIEFDSNLPRKYYKTMLSDNKMMDIMISNSKFCTKMYQNAFKFKGKIKEYGTPRNDYLLKEDKEIYKKVREKLGYSNNTKIILYAPTFRTNYENEPYDINLDAIKQELETATKEDWKVFIRLHPIIHKYDYTLKKKINLTALDLTNYPDMQELIAACDILITDYSSSMFEAMIINKPVILYVKDLEEYKRSRGLYFDLKKLPFLVCSDTIGIDKKICRFINSDYIKEYELFKKNIGLKENGNASLEICRLIKKIINNR